MISTSGHYTADRPRSSIRRVARDSTTYGANVVNLIVGRRKEQVGPKDVAGLSPAGPRVVLHVRRVDAVLSQDFGDEDDAIETRDSIEEVEIFTDGKKRIESADIEKRRPSQHRRRESYSTITAQEVSILSVIGVADIRHTTRFVNELELRVTETDVVVRNGIELLAQALREHSVVLIQQRDELRPGEANTDVSRDGNASIGLTEYSYPTVRAFDVREVVAGSVGDDDEFPIAD